ncbi:efflux RND transporter periplasmic adaptor subunit [Rhodocyclus purpureus]|uniref:efflux RND transporter periplasmic adaptor subunit n=1 Tax=Rhodocyclus purpureus TaxID=1067 RepID=UPI0019113E36|nr:efflux RND transporter periplasmic adaptor subunit [Rhodocyclus purpureus]MBK5913071.1 secretion protein HylD [Rhodocyclus purpureus]
MALPPLREELSLLPGPPLVDGQPSHTLHDPVRNLFFQIDWSTFEVLCRWDLGDPAAIAASIAAETTLQLEAADVEAVVRFLHENQLLQPPPGSAADFAKRLKQRKGSFGKWLLHNYLFFRIPLVKPDRWLGRWAGRLDFLYSRSFFLLTLAALGVGLVEVYRDWEKFTATLVDTLTWSGMASYGVALVAVKTLHEFGHGFTAKRFGCRVPTMGVAFLVLWPVAYTDTNEVWKLTDRRQRLQVAAAGVATELIIAVWATLAWALLPEGIPKSIAFLLATTTWITTVTINASPFLRFDGYFLMSDWLGMPNLHGRSFALARWDLRERLFALGEPVPESFSRRRHVGLILFAWATWIYRLVLFLGIAVLVYTFFIKAVGILLFLVEIIWFVLLPFWREFQEWQKRWPALRRSSRARRSAVIALAALSLLALPWPTRISAPGLLRPLEQLVIYAPQHAQVVALPVAEGSRVAAGTLLLQLASPDLHSREASAVARVNRLRWQASAGAFDAEQRAQWQVLQEQLATADAELASVQADAVRYAPVAPFNGVLRDLDPDLRPGVWLGQGEVIARLVAEDGQQQAVTYLDEEEIGRVKVGDRARFYADGLEGPFLALQVLRIDPDAARTLPEPELSTLYGGGLLVREKKGVLYPERALYRVTLKATAPAGDLAGTAWRGKVVIAGDWAVPGWRFLRSALSLFWREAGF